MEKDLAAHKRSIIDNDQYVCQTNVCDHTVCSKRARKWKEHDGENLILSQPAERQSRVMTGRRTSRSMGAVFDGSAQADRVPVAGGTHTTAPAHRCVGCDGARRVTAEAEPEWPRDLRFPARWSPVAPPNLAGTWLLRDAPRRSRGWTTTAWTSHQARPHQDSHLPSLTRPLV